VTAPSLSHFLKCQAEQIDIPCSVKLGVSYVTKKSIQEINFTPGQDRKNKFSPSKKRMPIARCLCGSEILVLPDLKAMSIAIHNHVVAHEQARDGIDRLDALTEFLTEQVLMVASTINSSAIN
jgi:hypothetical protein